VTNLEADRDVRSEPARPASTRGLGSVVWFWTKVALVLIVLDVLLFDVGWFWDVQAGPRAQNRGFWDLARRMATPVGDGPPILALGDSAVRRALPEGMMMRKLAARGVRGGAFRNFAIEGTDTTDAAVLAYASGDLEPWLVVYGASFADFKPNVKTSLIETLFADSGMGLETIWPRRFDDRLGYVVKHYWKLYKYRTFVRPALLEHAGEWMSSVVREAEAQQQSLSLGERGSRGRGRTAELGARFPTNFRRSASFPAWLLWYETQSFADYERYLLTRNKGAVARAYRDRRSHPWDVSSSPQLEALRWMLEFYRRRGTRFVLAYFPENPVFRNPEANEYFDVAASDATAALLAEEAARAGARFEDLRSALAPEDFVDMVHPNTAGGEKLAALLSRVVAEEWRRKRRESDAATAMR